MKVGLRLVTSGRLVTSRCQPIRKNRLGRLTDLVQRLRIEPDVLSEYDAIIRYQLEQGILEVTEPSVGKEFYLRYRPVIRKTAESTKMRIVYDASSKENESSPSLNECLESGP